MDIINIESCGNLCAFYTLVWYIYTLSVCMYVPTYVPTSVYVPIYTHLIQYVYNSG